MRRIGAVVLALILAWQVPAPVIAQSACGSYAVAVAPQPAGHPLSDNTVRLVDATGDVATASFDQPRSVRPSPKPGMALLRSLGGLYSLLDVASGKVTPIQIPEDQQLSIQDYAPTIHNATESDFMLLSNVPNATWLVDLRSGQAVELSTLLPNGGIVESAAIAPGGKWVEFYSKNAAWVISLEVPGDPVSVSSDPVLPYPGFDASGESLIFAMETDDGVEVKAYDPETGSATLLGTTPSASLLDVAVSDLVLVIDGQDLLTLPTGHQDITKLFTWKGATTVILGDTNGDHLLVGDELDDHTDWSWVDTATGETVELDDLTDMTPLTSSRSQDSVVFVLSPRQGPGTPGIPYRTVDLTTGQVASPLTQDSSEVWAYALGGDDAGRFALINAVSPGQGRMWLIDSLQGAATEIGTSSGNVSAQVSPDGCQLATAVFDTVGEGRTSVVTVTSLEDSSVVIAVPDTILLGWAETPSAG